MTTDNSTLTDTETWDRIIRPKSGLVPVDFAELWRYRELLFFLPWRNVLIRYKLNTGTHKITQSITRDEIRSFLGSNRAL